MSDMKKHREKYGRKVFSNKAGSQASVIEALDQKFQKPVVEKFKKGNSYARLKDNIWAADLTETLSLPSKTEITNNYLYILCVIDVFTKFAWVRPLKYKNDSTVLYAFIEIVKKAKHQQNIS